MTKYRVEFEGESHSQRDDEDSWLAFTTPKGNVYGVPVEYCTEIEETCTATLRLPAPGFTHQTLTCEVIGEHNEHVTGKYWWTA